MVGLVPGNRLFSSNSTVSLQSLLRLFSILGFGKQLGSDADSQLDAKFDY